MKRLSLEPDEHMKWIYDPSNPHYYSEQAKHLREACSRAIRSASEWMVREAQMNDNLQPFPEAGGKAK